MPVLSVPVDELLHALVLWAGQAHTDGVGGQQHGSILTCHSRLREGLNKKALGIAESFKSTDELPISYLECFFSYVGNEGQGSSALTQRDAPDAISLDCFNFELRDHHAFLSKPK